MEMKVQTRAKKTNKNILHVSLLFVPKLEIDRQEKKDTKKDGQESWRKEVVFTTDSGCVASKRRVFCVCSFCLLYRLRFWIFVPIGYSWRMSKKSVEGETFPSPSLWEEMAFRFLILWYTFLSHVETLELIQEIESVHHNTQVTDVMVLSHIESRRTTTLLSKEIMRQGKWTRFSKWKDILKNVILLPEHNFLMQSTFSNNCQKMDRFE